MHAALVIIAQQSTIPKVDGMFTLQLLSRILHIMGAIILVGGVFYIRQVISPTNATPGTAPVDQYFGGPRSAWAKWVGITSGLLIATGLFNLVMIFKQHEKLASSYHMIFLLKFIAAFIVFALAALLAGRTAVADKLRQNWRMWLTVCLVVSIITVALGSVLRTYPRTRKGELATPPVLMPPANAVQQ